MNNTGVTTSATCTLCNLSKVSAPNSVQQSTCTIICICTGFFVMCNTLSKITGPSCQGTMQEIESRLSMVAADMRQSFRETSLKDMNMGQLLRMKKVALTMTEALECEIRALVKYRSGDSDDSDSSSDTDESLGGEEYKR